MILGQNRGGFKKVSLTEVEKMFIYIVYEDFKNKYLETQKKYDEILKEKEELFLRTQPKAIIYDKTKINAGHIHNSFDEYLIAKEKARIDDRLNEIKSILEDREHLLYLKEQELRVSKNYIDQIYRMRFIDSYNIRKIAKISSYSESQIYRILKRIKKQLKKEVFKYY